MKREYYFVLNGREYGPFIDDTRVKITGPNYWIKAKSRDGEFLMVNGEVHGPYRDISGFNASDKVRGWSAVALDGSRRFLLSGSRGKDGPFRMVSDNSVVNDSVICFAYMEESPDIFVNYNGTKFGPYRHSDLEFQVYMSPDGKNCAIVPEIERDGPDERFLIVDEKSYGPYRDVRDFRFGVDGKSWGFIATDMAGKCYAVIKERTIGPFDSVKGVYENNGRWFYSCSTKYEESWIKTFTGTSYGPYLGDTSVNFSPGKRHYYFTAEKRGAGETRESWMVVNDVAIGPYAGIHSPEFSGSEDGWVLKADISDDNITGKHTVVKTSTGETLGPYLEVPSIAVGELARDFAFSYRLKDKDGVFIRMGGAGKDPGPFDSVDYIGVSGKGSFAYARARKRGAWYHVTAYATLGPYDRVRYTDQGDTPVVNVTRKGKTYSIVNGSEIGPLQGEVMPVGKQTGLCAAVYHDGKGSILEIEGKKFGPYEILCDTAIAPGGKNWAFAWADNKIFSIQFRDGTKLGPFNPEKATGFCPRIAFSKDGKSFAVSAEKNDGAYVYLGPVKVLGPYPRISWAEFIGDTCATVFTIEKNHTTRYVVNGVEMAADQEFHKVFGGQYVDAEDGKFFYWFSFDRDEGVYLNRVNIE